MLDQLNEVTNEVAGVGSVFAETLRLYTELPSPDAMSVQLAGVIGGPQQLPGFRRRHLPIPATQPAAPLLDGVTDSSGTGRLALPLLRCGDCFQVDVGRTENS